MFVPENDHHNLSSWSLLAGSSWCLFTWLLPGLGFKLAERIVVVYPKLIADYDAGKKVGRICFALLQELLTTVHWIDVLKWCQKFQYRSCANLPHAQLTVQDLVGADFWNTQFVNYATDRVFEATFWFLEFSHLLCDGMVRWSRILVDIIQLLTNFGGIQPFPGEKLYNCSMLNIRHIWNINRHGCRNVFFAYKGNEPIRPKVGYHNS